MDLFWLLLRSRGNDWRSRTGIVFSKEKTHPRFPEANRQYALTDGSELRFKDYPLRSYGPLFVKHNWCSYLKLSEGSWRRTFKTENAIRIPELHWSKRGANNPCVHA
jgi:hypothetical protein